VSERLRVREIDDDEGQRLVPIVRLWVPKKYATWAYAPEAVGSAPVSGGWWRGCTRGGVR
jgi:hypothetical protein